MPHLSITPRARAGLNRCRRFLVERNMEAADRASAVIMRQFMVLQTAPHIGRPYRHDPALRELVIRFGDSGYVALYRFAPDKDAIIILAFRHQREADYPA